MRAARKAVIAGRSSAVASSVAHRYDLYSRSYDALYTKEQVAKLDVAVEAGWRPGGRLIDYGCGTALLTSRMARRCETAVGMDISVGMLNAARKRRTVELVLADAAYPPFRRGAFGSMSCFTSFHDFRKPSKALGSMLDSLKGGGECVFSLLTRGKGSGDERVVTRNKGLRFNKRIVAGNDVILLMERLAPVGP